MTPRDLADRVRAAGTASLGTLPAVVGGRNQLADALDQARDATTLPADVLDLLGALEAGWTTRMALSRTSPEQDPATRTALVVSVCGEVLLVDRTGPDGHDLTLLDPALAGTLLASALTVPDGHPEPGTLLPDRELDPTTVAQGGWPAEVQAVLDRTRVVAEAAYARADEESRSDRPVVTVFHDGATVLCLEARPAQRSLWLRHRDVAGAGEVLAAMLREADTAPPTVVRRVLAPAARLRTTP